MMGIAEFIIGRAFARPVGSTRPTKLADCDNPHPPTRTIMGLIYQLTQEKMQYSVRGSQGAVQAYAVQDPIRPHDRLSGPADGNRPFQDHPLGRWHRLPLLRT